MEYEKAREVTQSQNYGISLLVSSTLSCMSYGRKFHTNHPVTHAKYSGMKNLMIIPISSVNLVSSVGTPNPTWVGVEFEKSQWSPSDLGMIVQYVENAAR